MEIRVLRPGDDDVLAKVAPGVFDDPLHPRAAAEFLRDPRHHIVVAIDGDVVVGFASAVHYVHPDKPSPELWINELGVVSSHQRRGIATAVLQKLLGHARELGCAAAWVLTERANEGAIRLYASSGGIEAPESTVMFEFRLDGAKA
ncbi:MAG TPA: GNAT family N-acetyltransferase [Vicinamibacterales bacterium]|jgi:aminoglycoside 6'-N-acetyltransferase I